MTESLPYSVSTILFLTLHVVGLILGHGAYTDPNFQTLLKSSINWVAKKD